MNALLADTPRYVLLDGRERASPNLLADNAEPIYLAIYGFSDKETYDLFCANSKLALTPYPLVKGYLQNQLTQSAIDHLVVVDAASPYEMYLRAATMKSVLEAHQSQANHVAVSFRLTLDQESQSYRVERASHQNRPKLNLSDPRSRSHQHEMGPSER